MTYQACYHTRIMVYKGHLEVWVGHARKLEAKTSVLCKVKETLRYGNESATEASLKKKGLGNKNDNCMVNISQNKSHHGAKS